MAIAIRGTTPATQSGTGDPTSLTLTGARQPNAGDVLIIIHSNDWYDHANIPTPTVGGSSTGVVAVTGGDADNGSLNAHTKSFYYVVGSTGDLTVAVDETGSADEEKLLVVYVLSGVDTSTPIDIAGNSVTGSTTPHVCPSVSPTSTDAFLICHCGTNAASSGTWTAPGTMTEQYDLQVSGAGGGTGGTQQLSASGATGTRTYTSATDCSSANITIAVKTATAGPAGDANQWTPRQLAAPVPRVFRTGIRAPIQLMGDKATPFQGTDAIFAAVAIVTTTAMDAPTEQTGSTVAATAIAAPVALPAPTVQTGSTVAAIAVATSSTLPAPALNTGSTVAAAAIDTATALPLPTVVVPAVTDPYQFFPGRAPMFYDLGKATQVLGDRTSPAASSDATVSAVAITTTAALPAPALQTGSTVAATDVVTTSSLPAPALQTGSTVAGVTVVTTTAMTAPSVIAGTASDSNQFLPGRAPMFYDIGKATQLQGDRTIIDATVAATVINTVTALDAPTVLAVAGTDQYQAGPQVAWMFTAPNYASQQLRGDASTGAPASSDATVTPPSVTTTATLPAPTLQTGSTVSATTLATVTALPAPSLSTGSTVAGTAIATVTVLPAPAIQTAGNTTVPATAIATVTDLPAPSLQTGSTVSATTLATVTSIPAPSLNAQTLVTPSSIATVTSLPAPTVQQSQTVSATALATVIAMPTPTVIGTFDGIKGHGHGHDASSARGSVYPPSGGIIGQAG